MERGRKRRRRRKVTPDGAGRQNGGIAPGRGNPQGPGHLEVQNKGTAGRTPGTHSGARGEGTQILPCFPRPVLLAGNISFSLNPLPIDKALSDAVSHPLMRLSLYPPLIFQERRPVRSPRGSQANPEPVKPHAAKEGEFLSLFLYIAKRYHFIKDGSGKDLQHR